MPPRKQASTSAKFPRDVRESFTDFAIPWMERHEKPNDFPPLDVCIENVFNDFPDFSASERLRMWKTYQDKRTRLYVWYHERHPTESLKKITQEALKKIRERAGKTASDNAIDDEEDDDEDDDNPRVDEQDSDILYMGTNKRHAPSSSTRRPSAGAQGSAAGSGPSPHAQGPTRKPSFHQHRVDMAKAKLETDLRERNALARERVALEARLANIADEEQLLNSDIVEDTAILRQREADLAAYIASASSSSQSSSQSSSYSYISSQSATMPLSEDILSPPSTSAPTHPRSQSMLPAFAPASASASASSASLSAAGGFVQSPRSSFSSLPPPPMPSSLLSQSSPSLSLTSTPPPPRAPPSSPVKPPPPPRVTSSSSSSSSSTPAPTLAAPPPPPPPSSQSIKKRFEDWVRERGGPDKFEKGRYQSLLGLIPPLSFEECVRALGPPLEVVKEEPDEGSKGAGAEGSPLRRRSSKVADQQPTPPPPPPPAPAPPPSIPVAPKPPQPVRPRPPDGAASKDVAKAEEDEEDEDEDEEEDERAQADAPSKPVIELWMEHVSRTGGWRRWHEELGKDNYEKLKRYATTDPNPAQSMDDMLRRADQYRTLYRMNKPF